MPHLEINTLGAFQARLDGQSLAAFRSDKVRALLVFLAVEAHRPHRREALAGMFWGERPDSASRNNLRQALYCLRETLHDRGLGSSHLLVAPNDIQFDPGSDYWLDVKEFSLRMAACRAHHLGGLPLCEDCLKNLGAAVALYGGDFLAGFSLPGCPQFDWWLLSRQERYHRQALETLTLLGSWYESCGDYPRAAIYARRELELEPWRETAHRMRMRALALSGQRGEALRQYESCRATLAQEMGIEPSRETTDLFETLRAGGIPNLERARQPKEIPGTPSLRLVTASSPALLPFVGFQFELAQLECQLAAALSGRARVALIAGEAGSGKTTLLARFIQRALAAHGDLLATVGGSNAQFGFGDPYLPFRQALHLLTGELGGIGCAGALGEAHTARLWAALPTVLEALLEEGPDLLGAFLPLQALIRRRAPISGEGGAAAIAKLEALRARRAGKRSQTQSQIGQVSFFDQFTRVLLAIARRYPLILALDDLQWADHGSLSLLFHLARNLGDSRVLLVGTYRPEDLTPDPSVGRHPMEALANKLVAQYGEVRVDLSKAGGRGFVNGLLDSEPNELDAAFRQALYQLTEGHPLFTAELLRGMQESGGLVRDQAGRWVVGEKLDWERIPARVEAVIAERLARLPDACRALLDAASVQGEIFSAEMLAVVLGESEAQIVKQLSGELCQRHRLVFAQGLHRLGGTIHSRYRFRHALYQRQLYQDLDPVLKARLHQVTGEALESRYTQQAGNLPPADGSPSRLAFHFEKAGLAQKAIQYQQKAGDQAYRLAANEEAIFHYDRALELLKSMPGSRENDRQELLILVTLSAALNAARGYAEPALQRLFAQAGELAAEIGEVDLVSQALYLRGAYHFARGQYLSTLDVGEQLLEASREKSIPWVSDIADFMLGIGRLYMGDFRLARAHLQKIKEEVDVDRVDYTTSPADRARLLFPVFLSWSLWFLGYPDQALRLKRDLLARVRELGYPYILAFTLGMSGCVTRALRGEIGRLQEQAQELLDLSTEKGFGLYQAWGKIFLGRAQVAKGEVEVGLINLQAGLDAFRATGHIGFLTFMLAMQAEAYGAAGQIDEGLHSLGEAFCLVDEVGERIYEAELHRLRGELLLAASGAEAEAESCFQKALQVARGQEAKSLELRAATSLAQLWARQGKASQAVHALGAVYNWFEEGFDTPDLQKAARLLAGLEI